VSKKSIEPVKKVLDNNKIADDSDELEELVGFKKTLGPRKGGRTPEELKRDFIANMDPASYESPAAFEAAQERIKGMPVGDFDAVLGAIAEDEEE